MPRVMTVEERQAFLADVHIGVISIEAGAGKAPFAVPVWYGYEPGGPVTVLTGGSTQKAGLIKAAGRYTLTVQDEAPPYKYVTVSGPVSEIVEVADPAERLAVAQRYLGEEGGRGFMEATGGRPNSAFRMRPEHWLSSDLSS